MQDKDDEDILEMYKNTDPIARNQMWLRFPTLRKAFDELDGNHGNTWQVSGTVPRADWYKKKIPI